MKDLGSIIIVKRNGVCNSVALGACKVIQKRAIQRVALVKGDLCGCRCNANSTYCNSRKMAISKNKTRYLIRNIVSLNALRLFWIS